MISAEKLLTLTEGSVIEVGAPLQGLAPGEPLVFQLEQVDKKLSMFHFRVHYFDIPVAYYAAKVQDSKVIWIQEKK